MNEAKMNPKGLVNKILSSSNLFLSRFLDITIQDLCSISKEQLERMVSSTIEQMPDEELRQFEIELAGGRREF